MTKHLIAFQLSLAGLRHRRTEGALYQVKACACVLAVAMMVLTAQAQIVHDMTPERIREAIAVGTASRSFGAYPIQEKTRWS